MSDFSEGFLADRVLTKARRPSLKEDANSMLEFKGSPLPSNDRFVLMYPGVDGSNLGCKISIHKSKPLIFDHGAFREAKQVYARKYFTELMNPVDTTLLEYALKTFGSQGAHLKRKSVSIDLSKYRQFCSVIPVGSIRRQKVGKWVTKETCDYIAEEMADCLDEGGSSLSSAACKIEYSMDMLLNSIAEGLRDRRQLKGFKLASEERFLDQIARAILFRLPISFYSEFSFMASLYRDFEVAVSIGKISHDWWDVSIDDSGEISLSIREGALSEVKGDKPWKKARAIRFSSLKSE